MTVSKETLKALSAPFPQGLLKYRVGHTNEAGDSAIALVYIEARTVQDRLDTTIGPENWTVKFDWERIADKTFCICTLSVRVEFSDVSEWVSKSDGAGTTNFEAVKGGMSDAFKRAAVHWGIGRSLYYFPSGIWVPCEKLRGRGHKILRNPEVPAWYNEGHIYPPGMENQAPGVEEPQSWQQPVPEVAPLVAPAPLTAPAPLPVAEAVQHPATAPSAAPVAQAALPANFPQGINPAMAINFGKKVMSNGRSIKEYTWGEISALPSGDEARNYVEWMAKAHDEKVQQGKDPFAAMKVAKTMVGWWMSTEAAAAAQSIADNTPVENPFQESTLGDAPF